jgi:hypothetical protein
VRKLPLAAAVTCLLGGFVTMAIMALATRLPKGTRPLWSYWSGTLGDLVLPIIIYGVTRACAALPSGGRSVVARDSYAAAAAGAALGLASQAAWLSDPNPRINWLVTAPHTFSAAGWYHATYLTITSAYVGGASWELLRRAKLAPSDQTRRVLGGAGATATLTAIEVFVVTVIADSVPSGATSSSQATIAIIVACSVTLLALAAARLGGRASVLARPLAVSLIITVLGTLVVALAR